MAKLTDMYEPDEIPTRPDWPNTVARRCRHCGKVYGEHAQTAAPQSTSGCLGIRKHFDPEESSDGEKNR